MKITIKRKKDIIIYDVKGEIDINSSALIESVGKVLKKGTKKIIINLEEVSSVDYNGLSVLAIAYKNVLNNKGIIKISSVPENVMELLRIVRLDNVFSIYENIDEALEGFESGTVGKTDIKDTDKDHPLRRRFTRLGMDINIYYKESDESDKENPLYSGLIGNLSGAGLFLRGIDILPAGTKLDLDIVIPETRKYISAKGIVAWIADKQLQPDMYPGMGVQFIDMDQKLQEKIVVFVERHVAK